MHLTEESKGNDGTMLADGSHKRLLFGGAFSCVIGDRFADASTIRQVPDHQEVFCDTSNTTMSLIIEILEYQALVPDSRCAMHHYNDLVETNGGTDVRVEYESVVWSGDGSVMNATMSEYPRCLLVATSQQHKFNNTDTATAVRTFMCCIRLKHVDSDFLITINQPMNESTSSAITTTTDKNSFILSTTSTADDDTTDVAVTALQHVMHTFTVNDWTIFGC